MGGLGSGRPKRKDRKILTSECHSFSIAAWVKSGHIRTGSTTATDGKRTVSILWTSCHYGGARPWFSCPRCNRRSGKLYSAAPVQKQAWLAAIGLPIEQSYRCRVCLGLTYQSANASRNVQKTCDLQVARLARKFSKTRKPAERQKIAEGMRLITLKSQAEQMRQLVQLDRRILKLLGAATGQV